MKIQYASDLHLEFAENRKFLNNNPIKPVGEILVLAGDIGYLSEYMLYADFWDDVSANFQETIVAIGNHELYTFFDLKDLPDGLVTTIRHNVKVYYNAVVQIDSVEFIISTLWSKIPMYDAYITERSVNDFHRIKYNGKRLSYNVFNDEHERCLAFVKQSVEQSTAEKIVVATHHVPSFALSSPDFAGSRINGAFTSELGDYIADSRINYWIYGHSHRNIDLVIGNTHCVSNQLGYVSHKENYSFDREKYIGLI
jgi:Icc-related predicted phosphoesterase